jgi:GNAT superfamily N-acetyltransferase
MHPRHRDDHQRFLLLHAVILYVQFAVFSLFIRQEKHLLPQSAANLWQQYWRGLSVVIRERGIIVAHVTLWPLQDNWYEYGTIWVHPDYRRHGLAKKILTKLLNENQDKQILATTTNDIVKRLNVEVDLSLQPFETLPQAIHRLTCVCPIEKRGTDDYRLCARKNKECALFTNN